MVETYPRFAAKKTHFGLTSQQILDTGQGKAPTCMIDTTTSGTTLVVNNIVSGL